MTNHVHLLLTPYGEDSSGQLMKRLGQRYVQYINRTYRRSGTLWEGGCRSCITQRESYILSCHRYIELNSLRAGIVEHPADDPWSNYRINGEGEESGIVNPHRLYESLGSPPAERQSAYRELFRYELYSGVIDEIRDATNRNFVLGDSHYSEQVEGMLGRWVRPGRPSAKL